VTVEIRRDKEISRRGSRTVIVKVWGILLRFANYENVRGS
jgi:hypothetical protein